MERVAFKFNKTRTTVKNPILISMEKMYYSISEVSEMLNISQSNLRFWEKEIKHLQPKRNKGNTRFYSTSDIQIVKNIRFLIEERNFTLEGVRQHLDQKKDLVSKQQETVERLKGIKADLMAIVKEL
mgnify:CR=1 FL=1